MLNANYVAARLSQVLPIAFSTPSLHEAVFTDRELEAETGVKTLDLAKRLIDYGFHPPTVYFPLVVRGALMVEPTETETKQTLDAFVDAWAAIVVACFYGLAFYFAIVLLERWLMPWHRHREQR